MNLKRNIRVLYAVSFLQGMVFYGPIATLYRTSAGISVFQLTLIESASLALCVALELPWGIVADRIGYRTTLLVCNGLYLISKLVFWKAEGFFPFLTERLMLSVVISGISGVDTGVLYLSCGRDEAQRVFGIYNNLNTAGLLLAAGIYAALIRSDFRLAGLLTVFSYGAAFILTFLLREVRGDSAARRAPLREFRAIARDLAAHPRRVLLVIAAALLNETHQTITVFLNQLQYVRCGMAAAAIGAVYAGITLLGLLGGFSARLTRRLGRIPAAKSLFLICAAACGILALTRSAAVSVAAIAALRIAFSLFQPLQTDLQNRQIVSDNRATALSVNAAVMDGVAIATNVAFGRAAERFLPAAMALGGGLCLTGLLLFCVWCRDGAAGAED